MSAECRTCGDLISVVMPCYNAAPYVREAINDVLGQTYRRVRLIVVDDGSTDNSADIVSEFGSRVTLIRQANAGSSAARNAGLRLAEGEYVAFLDADDRWDRCFLETMADALADGQADLAYCGWARFWGDLSSAKPFIPRDLEAGERGKLERMLEACPFPIHAVLVRRERLVEAGGFDRRFPPAEDYELWLRVATRCRFKLVPRVMAYYRRHPAQQTANHFHLTLMRWRALRHFITAHWAHVQDVVGDHVGEQIDGVFRREGYAAYWRGDLVTARRCFRQMMRMGQTGWHDLKVVLPSLLPLSLHRGLLRLRDGVRERGAASTVGPPAGGLPVEPRPV